MMENADVTDVDDNASVRMSNVSVSYDFQFEVDRETFDSYVTDSQVPKNVAKDVATRIVETEHTNTFDVVGSPRVVVDELDLRGDTVYVSGVVKQ